MEEEGEGGKTRGAGWERGVPEAGEGGEQRCGTCSRAGCEAEVSECTCVCVGGGSPGVEVTGCFDDRPRPTHATQPPPPLTSHLPSTSTHLLPVPLQPNVSRHRDEAGVRGCAQYEGGIRRGVMMGTWQ